MFANVFSNLKSFEFIRHENQQIIIAISCIMTIGFERF